MSDIISTCASCGQEFAIISLEQQILQKLNLQHPTQCFFCRKKRRDQTRAQGHFYKTNCQKCNQEICSVCDPTNGLMIYCKECYLAFRGSGESEKIFLEIEN